jgi:type IX secretion system PorP/SprF family membrane protein
MLKRDSILAFLWILLCINCFGQETEPGPGFQMLMSKNPAASGIEGDGTLRMSYLNFYPGNSYNLHSVYLSYDSYFTALHGGVGFYLSNDYLGGIINDLKGGFSYAYFLQAGRDLIINAGLSATFYHRGFNADRSIFPDQIDPFGGVTIPSSELLTMQGHTIFDIGAGFLLTTGRFLGGFSINHLTEPDLSGTGLPKERLKRKLNLDLSGDFNLQKRNNLKVRPVAFLTFQNSLFAVAGGAVFESNHLSYNTILIKDNAHNMNIQTGFSFKTGKLNIYYNYRFNVLSGNSLIPFSLLHQTGLAFSLNSVDKKYLNKTISFPKL